MSLFYPPSMVYPPLKPPPFLSGATPGICHRITWPTASFSFSVRSVLRNRELLLPVTDHSWIWWGNIMDTQNAQTTSRPHPEVQFPPWGLHWPHPGWTLTQRPNISLRHVQIVVDSPNGFPAGIGEYFGSEEVGSAVPQFNWARLMEASIDVVN